MAIKFSFKTDWGTFPYHEVKERLAECGCRPPGHPRPRFVMLEGDELKEGWECPHE